MNVLRWSPFTLLCPPPFPVWLRAGRVLLQLEAIAAALWRVWSQGMELADVSAVD